MYVIWDLKAYILILFTMTSAFTMVEFMNRQETGRKKQRFNDLINTFMDQYYLIFGENPEDFENKTLMQNGLYLAYTLLINIVNLNLLISIIGIKLDDMQLKQVSRDYATQAELALQMNCTYRGLRHYTKILFCNWSRVQFKFDTVPKFIHFLSTDIEADTGMKDEDFIEGRVKMMMKRQDKMNSEIAGLNLLL